MRTAHTPHEAGNHPLLLTDANGLTCQHLTAETFTLYDHRDQTETTCHRDDQWWDARMTHTINPAHIQFPVNIIWERP